MQPPSTKHLPSFEERAIRASYLLQEMMVATAALLNDISDTRDPEIINHPTIRRFYAEIERIKRNY